MIQRERHVVTAYQNGNDNRERSTTITAASKEKRGAIRDVRIRFKPRNSNPEEANKLIDQQRKEV
jgi:hypothetical protein